MHSSPEETLASGERSPLRSHEKELMSPFRTWTARRRTPNKARRGYDRPDVPPSCFPVTSKTNSIAKRSSLERRRSSEELLRVDQSGHRQLHEEPRPRGCRTRDQSELRSAGSDMDTVDSRHTRRRASERVRERHPSGSSRSTGGTGACVRVSRVAGVQLHHRRNNRSHRREAPELTATRSPASHNTTLCALT